MVWCDRVVASESAEPRDGRTPRRDGVFTFSVEMLEDAVDPEFCRLPIRRFSRWHATSGSAGCSSQTRGGPMWRLQRAVDRFV